MALAGLESQIRQKYPSLQTINKDQAYLHVWLPLSQKPLEFLPLFHVIVTLDNGEVKCRLFTYHGKQLQESVQNIKGDPVESSLLGNVENMGLCQGISRRKFVHGQDLIHEPFGDKVVYRSHNCKYAVQVPAAMVGKGIALVCSECSQATETSSELKQEPESHSPPATERTSDSKCDQQNGQEDEWPANKVDVICNPDIVEVEDHSELTAEPDSDDSDTSPLGQHTFSARLEECQVKVKVEQREPDAAEMSPAEVMDTEVKEEKQLSAAAPDVKKNLEKKLARLSSSIQVVKSQEPSQRDRMQGLKSLSGITISGSPSNHQKFRPVGGNPKKIFNNPKPIQRKETCNVKKQLRESKQWVKKDNKWVQKVFKIAPQMDPKFLPSDSAKEGWPSLKARLECHKPKHGEPPNNCEICLRYFKVPNWRHMCLIRHKEALNINMTVKCPVCSTDNIPKIYLTAHFAEKHSDLRASCCCECLEVIKMPDLKHGDELRKHILENHHTAQSKEMCPHCGQVYSGKNTLNHHIKLKHEKKAAYVCKICDKPFSKGGPYKAHMESTHGPKILKCLKCDMAFPTLIKLKLHAVSHTPYSPYSCSECGFSQKLSKRVLGHIKRMHPNSSTAEVVSNESDVKEMMRIVNDEAEIVMMTSKSNCTQNSSTAEVATKESDVKEIMKIVMKNSSS